jgi:S1-C subfamily serine protease
VKVTIMATALFLAVVSAYGQTQKSQPTLRETLGWIQGSLNDYGNIEKQTAKGTETRVLRLADFSGCRVHFIFTETLAGKQTFRVESSFDLGVVDPEQVLFHSHGITANDSVVFVAATQNAIEKISTKTSYGVGPLPAMEDRSALFIAYFYSPYGDDFTEAFTQAVKMCGGKPSMFAKSSTGNSEVQAPRVVGGVAARAALTRNDIPAIAKAANGAIVTIITAAGDKPLAQGTGFLVSADGAIVTNYHVIEEGNVATVKFPDGTVLPVDGVLAADKVRDLAVIKIHGKTFRTLTLGNSDQVQVGEEVVAIGNPLSLESTVSNGIVSGMRTSKEQGGKFLQTTAPISPGSSGGPLFNMAGEVVGINTMYLEGGENLNFAIPSNDAKRLLLAKSSKLQDLPNETEPVKAQTHDGDAPPSASATAQTPSSPDLKTTVEFMARMVEPEHRDVLEGEIKVEPHSTNGQSITITSTQPILMALTSGETHEHGYFEFTWTVLSDNLAGDGKPEQEGYSRYISFSLGDIDPSSIQSEESGYDLDALSKFWDKHPNCMANPQCADEYRAFRNSIKMATVSFRTADRKPLVEMGGFKAQQTCSESEKKGGECGLKLAFNTTWAGAMIFFKNKDRAERFVTALTYAVKLEGGKKDLFPPMR